MARPQKLSKEKVREIINLYVNSEFYTVGLINPKSIFEFAKELQSKGVIQSAMSLDFWRKSDRVGRKEIKSANTILSKTVVPNKKDDSISYLIDIELGDFLTKNYKEKETLAKMFLKLQDELRSLSNEKLSIKVQLHKVQEDLNLQTDNVQRLQKMNEHLQNSLLQIFEQSGFAQNGLINLQKINNKKTMNPFLKESLLNIFNSPSGYLNVQVSEEPVVNVVEFNNQKEKNAKSALDDFEFI